MRIALTDDYLNLALQSADWSDVQRRAEVVVFDRPLSVPDQAARALHDFDIICTLRERMPIPRALIERLPRLKYILVTGKRYDMIDVQAAADHGVSVSNTRVDGRSGGGGVSELVVALLLSLARDIPRQDRGMRAGLWQTQPGITLRGKTLGILGMGSLGRQVARAGSFFGMNVIAWSPSLTDQRAADAGVRRVTRDEIFVQSDFVTVHVAWNAQTTGLVGAHELALMKPGAFLVNTARGPIVDQDALLSALRAGRIAGAALDVYDIEPLPPDHPYRGLDNLVLTPHLGYFTREMLAVYYTDAVKAISAFLDGAPIDVVNGPVAHGRR